MDDFFNLTNGAHFNGAAQTMRLIWDIVMIAMCFYELTVRRRNGIILALFIFALGDNINAFYSVVDSIATVIPALKFLSSMQNPEARVWLIGTGVWIGNVGRYLIPFYLWIDKSKAKK
jgi:hypothetical protein